jgi:heme/copper-type cytochrome/quinol oxidase subunit 2
MDSRFASAIFWIAVACCVVAQIAIVRSAVTGPIHGSTEGDVPQPRRGTEVLWTIVPAIGLALLLYFTWRAVEDRSGAPTPVAAQLGSRTFA